MPTTERHHLDRPLPLPGFAEVPFAPAGVTLARTWTPLASLAPAQTSTALARASPALGRISLARARISQLLEWGCRSFVAV